MIDKKWIGHELPASVLPIERSRLQFFAKAIGETNPVYTDVAAARDAGYPDLPAPPTFLFAAAFSLITLRGRAMQLRENDALPELEHAYPDKAGFADWLTTPLRDVYGVPRGMTPLEAAAYDSTRRAVLAKLKPAAAAKPPRPGP